MTPVILIPSRMASTRLPNKPLADIAGKPMIVQVYERAMEADIADVVVAADDERIADAVRAAGGKVVLTDPNHPSGSDRIFEALNQIDTDGRYDVVINVQGDLPTLDPELTQQHPTYERTKQGHAQPKHFRHIRYFYFRKSTIQEKRICHTPKEPIRHFIKRDKEQ